MVRPVKHLEDPSGVRRTQEHIKDMLTSVTPELLTKTPKIKWDNYFQWSKIKPFLLKGFIILLFLNGLVLIWGWWQQPYVARMMVQVERGSLNNDTLTQFRSWDFKGKVLSRHHHWPAWVNGHKLWTSLAILLNREHIAFVPQGQTLIEISARSRTAKDTNALLAIVYDQYINFYQNSNQQQIFNQAKDLQKEKDILERSIIKALNDYQSIDGTKRMWPVSKSIDKGLNRFVDENKQSLVPIIYKMQEEFRQLDRSLVNQQVVWLNKGTVSQRVQLQEMQNQLIMMEINYFAMTGQLLQSYAEGIDQLREKIKNVMLLMADREALKSIDIYMQRIALGTQLEAIQVIADKRWVITSDKDLDIDPSLKQRAAIKDMLNQYKELEVKQQVLEEQVDKEKVTIDTPVSVGKI